MSNVVKDEQIPVVLSHVNQCIQRYQKDMAAALAKFKEDALFGISLDEKLSRADYAAIRSAVAQETAFRKLSDDTTIRMLKREIQAACLRRLPGPKRPRHLRHKFYPRWAKD